MTINEYSEQAITTLLSGHDIADMDSMLISLAFGLVGESGEVAEKFKKLIRDEGGRISEGDKQQIIKELGDVLWYINALSTRLGSSLEEVARTNIHKVVDRKSRGVRRGSGDNR
jgi:NTP pyrophosphatase (non-canonical NTP hydrolase)